MLKSAIRSQRALHSLVVFQRLSSTAAAAAEKQSPPRITPTTTPTTITYRDRIQEMMRQEKQRRLPRFLADTIDGVKYSIKRRFATDKDIPDPEIRMLFDRSAAQMYNCCSNKIPYTALCQEFGLPDYLSSWFRLTALHVWMVLLRLHDSIDAPTYERFLKGLITTMWADAEKRSDLMREVTNANKNTEKEMRSVNAHFIQSMFEYDEGFLSDDCILAAAVWRNLLAEQRFDPVSLNRIVRYIRATVSFLNGLETNDLLVAGVEKWAPAEEIAERWREIDRNK